MSEQRAKPGYNINIARRINAVVATASGLSGSVAGASVSQHAPIVQRNGHTVGDDESVTIVTTVTTDSDGTTRRTVTDKDGTRTEVHRSGAET